MSGFNEREKGFEKKFERDQENAFKIVARRNKLLGAWAAGKLGLSGDEAEAYAKAVVVADFEKPGDDDVLQKVLGDLSAKGVAATERDVRQQMDALLQVAREQIGGQG
ncbi:hypothetical protein STAQ_31660 [Allostella sp. ATCC 35155]|nr:hypothetical protein STAQ_31660 [Stella sp. ATCC 35155]